MERPSGITSKGINSNLDLNSVIFQRPLSISIPNPSHWGLGSQHMNFGGIYVSIQNNHNLVRINIDEIRPIQSNMYIFKEYTSYFTYTHILNSH